MYLTLQYLRHLSSTAPEFLHCLSTLGDFANFILFTSLRQACKSGAACFARPKLGISEGTVPHSDANGVSEATSSGDWNYPLLSPAGLQEC